MHRGIKTIDIKGFFSERILRFFLTFNAHILRNTNARKINEAILNYLVKDFYLMVL